MSFNAPFSCALKHSAPFDFKATTIIAVLDQPTSFFLVLALVLTVGCLSILIPVFVPKYVYRHRKEVASRQGALSDFTGMGKYSFAAQASRNIYSQASSRNIYSQASSRPIDVPGSSRALNVSSRHLSSIALSEEVSIEETMPRSMDWSATQHMNLRNISGNTILSGITRQGSAFFASEPQPVRRLSRESSARPRSRRTLSADAAVLLANPKRSPPPGNMDNLPIDKSSVHSLPAPNHGQKNARNTSPNRNCSPSQFSRNAGKSPEKTPPLIRAPSAPSLGENNKRVLLAPSPLVSCE